MSSLFCTQQIILKTVSKALSWGYNQKMQMQGNSYADVI